MVKYRTEKRNAGIRKKKYWSDGDWTLSLIYLQTVKDFSSR